MTYAPDYGDFPALLVDGTNCLRRYASSRKVMHPYHPLRRFVGTIATLIWQGAEVVVAWDWGKTSAWRRELHPGYKEHRRQRREVKPEERRAWECFERNREAALRLLPCIGVHQVYAEGVEADDMIYHYLARDPGRRGAMVLSSDSDLAQLFSHGMSYLASPKGGALSDTEQTWTNRHRIHPSRLVEYKALVGDSSDSIKGLRGIGAARAEKLIGEFGTLVEMLEAAKLGMGWIGKKSFDGLRAPKAAEVLIRNLRLIDLALAPVPASPVFVRGQLVPEAARDAYTEIGLPFTADVLTRFGMMLPTAAKRRVAAAL